MKKIIYLLIISTLFISMSFESDTLTVSKFQIRDENGKAQIKVSRKGEIKIGGKFIGTINNDGTLNSKEGKIIASISEESILKDANSKPLVKINKNGRIDNGSGKYIQWTEEGIFMKGEENTGITISPIDKKSFQTASIILFLYLSVE